MFIVIIIIVITYLPAAFYSVGSRKIPGWY